MAEISDSEWKTLRDIADPDGCVIHDGETIAMLLLKNLIYYDGNCYRLTEHGQIRVHEADSRQGRRPST